MKTIFILAFALAATLLSGCMPAYFVRLPGLEGRVVDAQGKPVPDAIVIVESTTITSEFSRSKTEFTRFKVEPDGRFFRRDEGSWGIFIAGMDFMRLGYSLKATSGGVTSAERDFSGGWAKILGLGDSVQKFGDIRLP
jgi:hypothetical protein